MRLFKTLILPLLIAASYPAHADLLGDTISVEHTAGAFIGPPFGLGPTIVAPACGSLPGFQYCVSADQITMTALQAGVPPDEGNLYEFDDISRDAMITGVSVDPATTIASAGLAYGQIIFPSPSSVQVFFQGLELIQPGQEAIFDLTFAPTTSPVPEPTSVALLGTGLLGAAASVFRRFHR